MLTCRELRRLIGKPVRDGMPVGSSRCFRRSKGDRPLVEDRTSEEVGDKEVNIKGTEVYNFDTVNPDVKRIEYKR